MVPEPDGKKYAKKSGAPVAGSWKFTIPVPNKKLEKIDPEGQSEATEVAPRY
jgi:hypothetical protein